jgi:hypothetical protein
MFYTIAVACSPLKLDESRSPYFADSLTSCLRSPSFD